MEWFLLFISGWVLIGVGVVASEPFPPLPTGLSPAEKSLARLFIGLLLIKEAMRWPRYLVGSRAHQALTACWVRAQHRTREALMSERGYLLWALREQERMRERIQALLSKASEGERAGLEAALQTTNEIIEVISESLQKLSSSPPGE